MCLELKQKDVDYESKKQDILKEKELAVEQVYNEFKEKSQKQEQKYQVSKLERIFFSFESFLSFCGTFNYPLTIRPESTLLRSNSNRIFWYGKGNSKMLVSFVRWKMRTRYGNIIDPKGIDRLMLLLRKWIPRRKGVRKNMKWNWGKVLNSASIFQDFQWNARCSYLLPWKDAIFYIEHLPI